MVISSPTYTFTHNIIHFSPAKVENGLDKERENAVVIFSTTHTHTNIMYFSTTHPLELRMVSAWNEERQWSLLVLYIYTYNSP